MKELKSANNQYGQNLQAGDRVAFVADIYDPRIATGIITKIYDRNDGGSLWTICCSIKEDAGIGGMIRPNVQIRRIYRIDS